MKLKEIIDLKGCYSAHDVGEKEIVLDEEKVKEVIAKVYCHNGTVFISDWTGVAKALCAALPEIIKVKQ